MITAKRFLALILCSSLATSTQPNFIFDNHLDTVTAFALPACLTYSYWEAKTVKGIREKAQYWVDRDKSNICPIYNNDELAELKYAYWVINEATDTDIKEGIRKDKWFSTLFIGGYVGLIYSVLRYSDRRSLGVGVVFNAGSGLGNQLTYRGFRG